MRTIIGRNNVSRKPAVQLARVLVVAGFLFGAADVLAQMPPPGFGGGPTNTPLDSWSFADHTNWTSDLGESPASFSNLAFSILGDGASLVVATNVPAWLQFNAVEGDNTTNLTVDVGSVSFWYAPANWASADTNANGAGPGNWAQLIDVGEWTTNASDGYWGFCIDPGGTNVYFAAQDGLGDTYAVSSPISWTTNYFHFIALTYSGTNVSLYLDGQLATNDPGGLNVWPGSSVLAGGIYFGSDTNGSEQANGLFNTIETYNYPLDSNDVARIYNHQRTVYEINPYNIAYMDINQAPSNPSTNMVTPDVITGAGYLQANGAAANNVYGTNAYNVWITNVTATVVGNGTTAVSFTIEGGSDGAMYDVFATGSLQGALTNDVWFWMGQGGHFTNYTVNVTSQNAFLILGTPVDSDNDGLTDAYEKLVSHTDPNNPYSNLDGILDGWEVLLGLNPQDSNITDPVERANYGYTLADWLNGVTGVKSGTIGLDNEGNVLSVSQ
ncbi:MAG: hypothetical protein KGJ88_12125 [Verrucomicrobiota bacterium]|nr:hypothetical protein [Verrucomicrobiota bacterium]